MIVKDLEPQTFADPLRRAGHEAERQMAHYLKRAFGESTEARVLHNLRLERQGEIAQLDHLILHRHGVIIVESKSVTGQVSVNERGEWTRWWRGQGRGMPSPVLQARRQGELLHALLRDHCEHLLGKMMFGRLQKGFGAMHLDVLVAISDEGIIRGGQHVPPEVMKADQIPDRVREWVSYYRRANNVFTSNWSSFRDAGFEATDAELAGIAAFLSSRHTPLEPAVASTPAVPAARAKTSAPTPSSLPQTPRGQPGKIRPAPAAACQHCASANLSMQYGKYGYYLKCRDCAGNTPAKPVCAECGQSARLSKAGREFTASCPGGHTWGYFTHPGDV